MNRHTITIEDVQPTIDEAKILLAHSGDYDHSKSLFMIPTFPNHHFHIFKDDKIVMDTVVLAKSIEKYNELN